VKEVNIDGGSARTITHDGAAKANLAVRINKGKRIVVVSNLLSASEIEYLAESSLAAADGQTAISGNATTSSDLDRVCIHMPMTQPVHGQVVHYQVVPSRRQAQRAHVINSTLGLEHLRLFEFTPEEKGITDLDYGLANRDYRAALAKSMYGGGDDEGPTRLVSREQHSKIEIFIFISS